MNKLFKGLLYLFVIIVFSSCEIGLGSAVDTKAPSVSITAPETDSVIRDSFAIQGNWSDDGKISSLKVILSRPDGFRDAVSYDAVLTESNIGEGTWTCVIDPVAEDILDGSYEVSVIITDEGGHATKVNRGFKIDNTAPVIVLKRPGTKVGETPDAYGQTFSMDGSAGEENQIDHIDVKVYDNAACDEAHLLKTITKSNISHVIELDLAEFEEHSTNDYSEIYGSTEKSGTKNLWCTITVYDNARRYPATGEVSAEDLLGNSTSVYYLYDDIYKEVLSDFSANDIYKILSGLYTTSDESRAAKSENIETILSNHNIEKSTFSLNPENNPKFSVSGKDQLEKDGNDFTPGNIDITNGSEVVVEVATGLDGISIDPTDLRPYVLPCDSYGNPSVSNVAENRIYLADKGTWAKSGTSYKFVVSLVHGRTAENTDVVLDLNVDNPYYIFGVEGYDVNGNAVVPNGKGYGFLFVSNGAAPDLGQIQTSTDGVNWTSDEVIYLHKGSPLYVKGSVGVETGLAALSIFKDKSTNPEPIVTDTSTSSPHTMYTNLAENGSSTFEYMIPSDTFSQTQTKQYSIRIEASNGKVSYDTVTVRYDVEGPSIKNYAISPKIADSTSATLGLLNGNVTLTGLLSDSYSGLNSENAKWTVFTTEDTAPSAASNWTAVSDATLVNQPLSNPDDFSFTFDTTKILTYDSENPSAVKYIKVVLTAYDEAGNSTDFSYIYTVDQSSDFPFICVDGTSLDAEISTYTELRTQIFENTDTECKNLITKGATVTFKLSDDDGFMNSTSTSSGFKITRKKNQTQGSVTFVADESSTDVEYLTLGGNPTSPILTYSFPDETGAYELEIELTDMVGNLPTSGKTQKIYVQCTGNAPEVSKSISPAYVTTNDSANLHSSYIKKDFTVVLAITDGSAPYTVTRNDNPDAQLTVDDSGEYPTVTDTFTPAAASSSGTIGYTVRDVFGKRKAVSVDYKVDNAVPSLTISDISASSVGTDNASYTFAGHADDLYNSANLSGVAAVEIDFDTDHSTVYTASGTENWSYIARFSELNLHEGQNTIYARAIDNVGNQSEWSTKTFIYDVSDPEATIAKYIDRNADERTIASNAFDYGYKFSLKGRAYDSNAVATVKLVQTKEGEDPVTITSGLTRSGNEWTCGDLPRAADGENFAADSADPAKAVNGTYRYVLYVTDAAGKEKTTSVCTVTVDNIPPELTLDAPAGTISGDNSLSGNTFTFKATSTDNDGGTGSAYIFYKFDDETSYTQVSCNDASQWKLTKLLGTGTSGSEADLYEGQHTFYIYSVDKAGNESTHIEKPFYIDQEAPFVTETLSTAYVKKTETDNGKVQLSGSVTESNGVNTFTVKRVASDSSEETFTIINNGSLTTSSAANTTWTYIPNTNGAVWSFTDYPGEGSYSYVISAVDNAGRTNASLTKSIVVDTTLPVISAISIAGKDPISANTDNSSNWYNAQVLSLNISVDNITETGSQVSSVEYATLASSASETSPANSSWVVLSLESGENGESDFYSANAMFTETGSAQKLFIRIKDNAGNVNYFNTDNSPIIINIDPSVPELSAQRYKLGTEGTEKSVSGTVFVNGSTELTVWGEFRDPESGIAGLTFKLGTTEITPTIQYSVDGTYKASFTPSAEDFGSTENTSKVLSVSGVNTAGTSFTITPFSLVYDNTNPGLTNISLTKENSNYAVYQPSSAYNYFVNNTEGTFTLSGNASDTSGVDNVKVEIFKNSNTTYGSTDTANPETPDITETFRDTAAYVWTYSGINLTGWTEETGAKIKVIVTDAAGNKTTRNVTLNFDVTGPIVTHLTDVKNKDLYLRVGSNDNEVVTDSTHADYDTDVGGKYESGTYGNALTMKIRGYFADETGGSGASKVYYYVTQTAPTETDDELKNLVLTSPTGVISKLSTESQKNVCYNVTPGATAASATLGGTKLSDAADNGTEYDRYYKTISSNFMETLSGFNTGTNYLVLVVTDNVGNSSLDIPSGSTNKYFTLNVEQDGPVITTNTTGIQYSNGGSGNITLSGTVTDAQAGVKSLSLSVTVDDTHTYTYSLDDDNLTAITGGYDWTCDVPHSIFAGCTGTKTITAIAVDKAGTGNTSTLPVATILVDTTGPSVTIQTSSSADTRESINIVNGKMSLSGIASDTSGLSTSEPLTLYYTRSEDTDNFGTDADSAWVKLAETTSDNSWTFTNINTPSLEKTYGDNDVHQTTVYFMVAGKDEPGNTGYSNRFTVIVDQDTDRPVIQFQNLKLLGENDAVMASSAPLPFSSGNLYGSVTDDDGVSGVRYKIGENGSWNNATLSNGSFNISLADGPNDLYFEVTDTEDNKTFTSSSSDSYSEETPKLTDSDSNKYGYRDSDTGRKITVTYIKIDTTDPYLGPLQFTTDVDSDNPIWKAKSEISSLPFGGTYRPKIKIRVPVYDVNLQYISAPVSMTIPGYTGSAITFTKTVNAELTAYPDAYYYESNTITLSSTNVSDGTKSCSIVVNDGSRQSTDTFTIVVDNTAPTITRTLPSASQYSSGSVTASGETNLTKWKNKDSTDTPSEYLYYALSLNDTTSPAVDNTEDELAKVTAITGWKDENGTAGSTACNYKPYYTPVIGDSYSWNVYFDGLSSTTASHDKTVKQFLIDSGVTTKDKIETTVTAEKFTTIVQAYLWMKAVDEAGNSTVEKFDFLIDPQGDAPTVTIEYPEENGTTLSSDVTLRGNASDNGGVNNGVDSVWIQIISAKENAYDSSTITSTQDWESTTGSLKFTDTVTPVVKTVDDKEQTSYSHAYTLKSFAPKLKDVKQWVNAENASGTKLYEVYTDITNATPTPVTTAPTGDDDADGSAYYIKATFSSSSVWTQKINRIGEFNPGTGKVNPIAFRVYAKDKDNNLSRYQEMLGVFDSDNPVISNVYLRQYSDNVNGIGDIVASRPYEADMWIKDVWWLCGNVSDTQGIKTLEVGPEGARVEQTVNGGENVSESFKYKLESGEGVGSLSIEVSATDNVDSSPHTEKKTYSINFDNEAPVNVTSGSKYSINTNVKNDNFFYTFGAQVTENSIDNKTQSGFAYLAFWFEKNIGNSHIVYDVMRSKANSEVSWADLTEEDGLMWKSVSVTRDADSQSSLRLTSIDPNVHAGGLCKIQGSIYFISSVSENGLSIEIDGQPEYKKDASGNPVLTETVKFAIANVVNKEAESGAGERSTEDGKYGYYKTLSGDDGDHMLESVNKQGTTWTWEANINSQNMKDGAVTLHYVAFDKAGKYAEESVEVNIANNAPRLASLTVWSDFNEDGEMQAAECDTKYYKGKERKIDGNYLTKATDVTSELVVSANGYDYNSNPTKGSAFKTVKATTRFIPELVGGNNELYYTYKYGSAAALDSATPKKGSATIGNGTDDGIDEDVDSDGYYIKDDNESAYISGHSDVYVEIPGSVEGEQEGDYTLNMLGNSTSNAEPTWFEYTIYDTTEGSTAWTETENYTNGRLSAKFRVALNVQYRDTTKPNVTIDNLYWKSLSDNSVYSSKSKVTSVADLEGHIELPADFGTTAIATTSDGTTAYGADDPKVSGIIKVEGDTFDDIKLKEIWVQMSNHTNLSTSVKASTYTGTWSKVAYSAETGWGFEAKDVFCNGEGHKVHWTLIVDTAKRTDQAQLDQTVKVYAVDDRGAAATNTSDETEYKMDIVPYIAGLKTGLSKFKKGNSSVFDRTSLGSYAVSSTETFYIYGFNMGGAKVYDSANTEVALTALTDEEVAALEWYSSSAKPAGSVYSLSASTLKSGNLTVKTKNISSLNNINNNDVKGSYDKPVNLTDNPTGDEEIYSNYYNRCPNGDSNNLLTDDVAIKIWQFDSTAVTPKVGSIEHPVMAIDPVNKNIGFAFVGGTAYFSMPYGKNSKNVTPNSFEYWIGGLDAWNSVSLAYDINGYSYATAAGGDLNTSKNGVDIFRFTTSRWNGKGTLTTEGYKDLNNQFGMEYIGEREYFLDTDGTWKDFTNFSKERIKSPSLATVASTEDTSKATVYLAYYDSINDEIRFSWGVIKNKKDDSDDTGMFGTHFDATRTSVAYSISKTSLIAGQTTNKAISTTPTYASSPVTTTSGQNVYAGEYVSIAALSGAGDSDNAVVAVWWDGTNHAMKYSYNKKPTGIAKGEYLQSETGWSAPVEIFSGEVGEYCKVTVDANNGVHIAAYDSTNGDIWYAYLKDFDNTSTKKVGCLDSNGFVGSELNIDVALVNNNPVPYISYYASNAAKPKIAKWVGSALTSTSSVAGAEDDLFTSNWEVSYVPTQSKLTLDHINVAVWKTNAGVLTTSLPGTKSFVSKAGSTDNSYGTVWGNGTNNEVLGYAIKTGSVGYIETAQIK